jgi:formate-dependent nitrite reductase membrane component NrfD
VLDIFLAGLGGGTFLFSFTLLLLDKYNDAARLGAIVGPLLVLLGSLMVISDLGSPIRAYRLFTTPARLSSSWMIRGAWILAAFIFLGLAYALPAFRLLDWLPWSRASGLGQGIGIAAAFLAIIVTVYPGLLLGVIKSIPLWNTSALPPLFFLSGLNAGSAAFILLSLPFTSTIGVDGFHLLGAIDAVLLILLLVVLGAYIEIVRQSGTTAATSVHLLKTPLFIGGAIVAGLLLPLGMLIFSTFVVDVPTIRVLDSIAGVLILSGGLILRLNVVKSGVLIAVS